MFVNEAVADLLSEAETTLSDDELAQVGEYGRALVNGFISSTLKVPESHFKDGAPKTLGEVISMPIAATTISISKDYLESTAGADDIKSLSLTPDNIAETLYARISRSEIQDRKPYTNAANRSNKWFREKLTDSFDNEDTPSGSELTGSNIAIDLDPDRTIAKASAIQAYRQFYRHARTQLNHTETLDDSPQVTKSKNVLLDVHVGRANALMALHYPHLFQLAEQLRLSPNNEQTQSWTTALMNAAPVLRYADLNGNTKYNNYFDGFARRLDIVRNGRATTYDQSGNALPISKEVELLAGHVEKRSKNTREKVASNRFTADQLKEMAQTSMNAEEFSLFLETILIDKDLLSQFKTTYDEYQERSGTAEDGKWQVVISPKAASLSVEGNKKAMIVASNFDRTLTQLSPAGCLPLAAHEISHVYQAEIHDDVAKQIPLAAIRGRRSVTVAEMGGLFFERRVFDELGIDRKINTMYVRGLQEKLAGGSITEVARTMYDTVRQYNGVSPEKGRQVARTAIRLYRHAGHNSQPLDYIEQELLAEELRNSVSEGDIASFAITASSFSLPDAAALHQAGLFELPDIAIADPSADVLRIYQKRLK